jgi:hypothetical protein
MPYQGPGVRVKAVNGTVGSPAVATLKHGNAVNINGLKGIAAKSSQVDRWTLPANAQAIGGGEEFVVMVGGVCEIVLQAPNPTSVAQGDYIEISAAGVVTKGTIGTVTGNTLGVVQEVDTSRTPNVARVNTNLP